MLRESRARESHLSKAVIRVMATEDTVRRFLICIACLCLLKILESWLLGSWLSQEEETMTKIREPLVSHPRLDFLDPIESLLL